MSAINMRPKLRRYRLRALKKLIHAVPSEKISMLENFVSDLLLPNVDILDSNREVGAELFLHEIAASDALDASEISFLHHAVASEEILTLGNFVSDLLPDVDSLDSKRDLRAERFLRKSAAFDALDASEVSFLQ